MKKLSAVALMLALVACGGSSTTQPTEIPAPPVVSAPPASTVGAPTIVAPAPSADGWDVTFSANATFSVKNTGPRARAVYAYITSFDNQARAIAPGKSTVLASGATFAESFKTTCVQLDLSTEGHEGRPDVGFAYFDKLGLIITPANRAEKIAECRRGTPTPEPTPNPTPRPSPSPSPSPSPTPEPSCESTNPPGYFDQSEEDNKNIIKFNVHVRNNGAWVFKLYATSTLAEYTADEPDFLKDTDSKTLACKGQGELKVDYSWKDHPSKYWYAVLYLNGAPVYKSAPVIK
jgi:hypothetical protein